MIRHALPSCTVTATSGSVHGATTRSCLIAPPSFPLVLAAGILRAGSEAVDLAAIAVPTDKNLRAAATTQKQSARHFIGAVRHINPQPSAVSSSLQPRADRACRRARASQGQALRVAAKTRPALTGPARDGCAIRRSGRKNARGAGRTKEWNLRTQYPNRYSIFAVPNRRRHVRYQSRSPFTDVRRSIVPRRFRPGSGSTPHDAVIADPPPKNAPFWPALDRRRPHLRRHPRLARNSINRVAQHPVHSFTPERAPNL